MIFRSFGSAVGSEKTMLNSGRKSFTFYFIFVFLLVHPLLLASACSESCGSTVVPYPFGLSRCGLSPFRLNCDRGKTLQVQFHSITFTVFSVNSQSIVVDPLISSNCSTPNAYIFSSLPNYIVSPKNVIQMYNCTKYKTCTNCSVYAEVKSEYLPLSCPSSFCCSIPRGNTVQNLTAAFGCNSFSSWVLQTEVRWLRVQLQLGLELEAIAPGPCSCSKNAKCKKYSSPEGYACHCEEGFTGDGYIEGLGCQKNATVCDNKSFVACSKKFLLLVVGIVFGVTTAAFLILGYVLLRRKNQHSDYRTTNRRSIKQIERLLSASPTSVFSYRDLGKATEDFSETKKLGSGAFGTVYAGKLQDGRPVAVKRINNGSLQGIKQVVNEVKILSAASHPNLVRLLGYCLDFVDPLLVYEYIPNGTLADHLHGERGERLRWSTRVSIAVETARALAYLHSLDPPIYHRDVKSSNILLHLDFTSKVADFGLSRLVLSGHSNIATTPQGTPGYLDPEYHQNFQLSDKSDVYSYGVVLLEMITGMKAVDFSRGGSEINLAVLALTRISSGALDEIIDPFLFRMHKDVHDPAVFHLHKDDDNKVANNDDQRSVVHRVAELAFRCLSYDKDARPTMQDVVDEMELIWEETTPLEARLVSRA